MNKIKLLFCAAVLFTGCALSDFSDYENHDLLSLNQEMSLSSKQVYYYYSGEKLFLTQRKDLLYIQFDDVYAKKRITTELNKDYSFQNWSPYGKSLSGAQLDQGHTAGTLITDIEMQLWAETPGYSGNVRIGTAIDNNLPTFYYDFAFGSGDTYTFTLPDTTVPDMSRRTLYVNIINPY